MLATICNGAIMQENSVPNQWNHRPINVYRSVTGALSEASGWTYPCFYLNTCIFNITEYVSG